LWCWIDFPRPDLVADVHARTRLDHAALPVRHAVDFGEQSKQTPIMQ
jgi:hypothetical protein